MPRISRQTKQKELIAEIVSTIDEFFSAEEVYRRVVKKDRTIGIATIYRYLSEAKGKGELYSYTCDRRAVYSNKQRSHCHFICEKTGVIKHFDVDNIDFLKDKIPGKITSFQLEVRGICGTCDECSKK